MLKFLGIQLPHPPEEGLYVICDREPLVVPAKTSMRPPLIAASGAVVSCPPTLDQPDQLCPLYELSSSWPAEPRTKTLNVPK
ncbi:MAG: hypothetical protein ACRDH9_09605, partial [Actinomycetota bacterium]